ncbi:hypothetical protein V2A60_006298 [Cordyceps javanica]|uniref:Aminoglycoside phosphotransferase n=1 Tax=Cordyceps javanica TaxID=43265 RepID=A0A545V8E0_9HYPO|nr:Aminoglycoside phosphotransferase [Cordyceps javanica]TQW08820.1 Aminoglycoside phosphotransferase [Cordyceps javanica]
MELAQAFAAKAGLSHLESLAEGLEFNVYKAESPTHGAVVLRVPKCKVFQNANDPDTDARDLVRQEAAILELLQTTDVPVPRPYGCYEIEGYPAMVCEYMPGDSAPADDAALGRMAALIHATPVPSDWPVALVAMEGHRSSGGEISALFLKRMRRRFAVLGGLEPQTRGWAVDEATLGAVARPLLGRFGPALLHMDLRHVNVRMNAGRVSAVFDWTNALLAPPVVDVYRSLEWGARSEPFLAGYRSVRALETVSAREEAFLRLDAALVLALVFVSEAPDPERRVGALRRVQELCEVLKA